MVCTGQQFVPVHRLHGRVLRDHMGVINTHPHAKSLCQPGHMATDFAIPDDAHTGTPQLQPHAGLHSLALTVRECGRSDVATQIDHDAHDPFRHRRTKTGAGTRDQNTFAAGRCHIDGANVDGATHSRQQAWHRCEKIGIEHGLPVGDQHLTALGGFHQLGG